MANPLSTAWQFLRGARNRPPTETTVSAVKNLSNIISPVQLERIRQDVLSWREAILEAEQAWYPHRVKMIRLYQDTVLNWQVYSCMERRKDLTRLRDFVIDVDGEESEEWTNYFKAPWFRLWLDYGLDAMAYGYSLVIHSDMVNNNFPDLHLFKRQNVSPDRLNATTLVYQISGYPFKEEPYLDWCTYFPTPSDNGASRCGYGYLYPVALTEIYLRNNIGANANYVQTYGTPFRHGKTSKTEEYERRELENTLAQMGVSNWAVTDPEDEILFVEAKGSASGNGFMAYDNLETRMERACSKIILGHEDAISSTPGKLGSGQDGKESPVYKAMAGKQAKDGAYIESIFNDVFLPKLRNVGINIPLGAKGRFKNDEEEEAARQDENEQNQAVATIFKTIADAGGDPDWAYFTDRTGIKVEKKEVEEVETPDEKLGASLSMVEKVKNLYRK